MPARDLFVDTGAWVALAAEDDAHHEDARRAYPRLLQRYQRLITTNLVVAETYILLLKRYRDQDFSFTDAASFISGPDENQAKT